MIFEILLWVIIFMLGAAFGSFIAATVVRFNPESKESLEKRLISRSHCDNCKYELSPLDLVPIFSYLFLKGKCRKCKKKIAPEFFIMELVSGSVFFLNAYINYDFLDLNYLQIFINTLVISIFLYYAYYDYLYWLVPIKLTIFSAGFFLFLLILRIIFMEISFEESLTYFYGALAGAGFSALLILVSKGKGLGWGDVWLFGLVGLIFGLTGLFEVFFIAVAMGAIVGIGKVVYTKTKLKGTLIQFVPFISMGVFFTLIFENALFNFLFWGF